MKCRASGDIFQTIYIAVSMMYLGGAPLAQCSPAHARPRRRLKGPPPPGGPATRRPGGSGPGSPGQHTRLPLAVGSQAQNGETPSCTRNWPGREDPNFPGGFHNVSTFQVSTSSSSQSQGQPAFHFHNSHSLFIFIRDGFELSSSSKVRVFVP